MSESPLENVSKILQEGEFAITCQTWLPGDADLRTRIAAALLGDHCVQGMTAPCEDCEAHALRQADAVIRELGLEPERRVGPGEPGEGLSGFIRYVTGWEVDD